MRTQHYGLIFGLTCCHWSGAPTGIGVVEVRVFSSQLLGLSPFYGSMVELVDTHALEKLSAPVERLEVEPP